MAISSLQEIDRFFALLDRALAHGPQEALSRPVAVRFSLGDAGSWLLRASLLELLALDRSVLARAVCPGRGAAAPLP